MSADKSYFVGPFEVLITDASRMTLLHISTKDDGGMPFVEVWPGTMVNREIALSVLDSAIAKVTTLPGDRPMPSTGSGVKPPPNHGSSEHWVMTRFKADELTDVMQKLIEAQSTLIDRLMNEISRLRSERG